MSPSSRQLERYDEDGWAVATLGEDIDHAYENQSDQEIEYNFMIGAVEAELTIPAHAMQTLVY